MAPQNVSFIDSSADDGDDPAEVNPSRSASKRLSQLNITSGSKTYRVHSIKKKLRLHLPGQQGQHCLRHLNKHDGDPRLEVDRVAEVLRDLRP